MRALPLATVELDADLPPEALLARLGAVVGRGAGTAFEGSVDAGGFGIERINDYRTTFLPVMRGRVSAAGSGSRVRLRVRPHGTVLAFLGIWSAFLAACAALAVAWRLRDPGNSLVWLAGPLLLAGVTWRIVSGVFSAELDWSVERLREAVPELRGAELLPPRSHL